jgi:fungalysin metallopeptidase (M36)/fungalysin/thermolysin propeptide
MTRKIFFIALLGVAFATAALFPFANSNASRALPDKSLGLRQSARTGPLPNYDIRLVGKGEFTDYDLSPASAQAGGLNVAAQARAAAVARFRSKLNPDVAQKLRARANETGAIKNLFIEGATLSEPRSDTADNIARGFLGGNAGLFALRSADAANLRLINEDNDRGTTFLEYAQTVGGLKVFEGGVQVVVNKNGEVLSVREGFLIDGQTADLNPTVDENQAIVKAFGYADRNIDSSLVETRPRNEKSESSAFANPLGTQLEDVLSELNVLRVGNSAKLAWHIYAEIGPDEWYESLVDAHSGQLLLRHNLYVFDAQGTVYTEAPDKGARQLVSFVGDTVINTSFGWMGPATVTTGNNVEAYLDTNADNAPDNNNGSGLSTGHASSATQDFTFPFSTAVDPRTQQAAVVTNLFYFNNVIHDFSYNLGFTETSRNFQTNNYGRGGIGNDSVRAEAQDGSGTNNANFATPPDGSRPRMQQYLFTSPNPDRDSSVDGDVVFHEFGHGISNRLIGNGSTALSGTQSGAMGEGWSDYWAITINNDGAVGEYVTNNVNGIRRAAYTVPAATVHDSYADVCFRGCGVHKDGEVWAATLWDLRAQLGAAATDLLVLNGMKFTPTRPSFLDARDGILQADQNLNGGANFCTIWIVFARHGMGVSASGNDGHQHNAATDVPPGC